MPCAPNFLLESDSFLNPQFSLYHVQLLRDSEKRGGIESVIGEEEPGAKGDAGTLSQALQRRQITNLILNIGNYGT